MASVKRSRRAEVPPPAPQRPHLRHGGGAGIATQTRSAQNILQNSNPTRSKRPFDPAGREFDAIKHKKAKITVEILSRHPATLPLKAPTEPANAITGQPQTGARTTTTTTTTPNNNSANTHRTAPVAAPAPAGDSHPALTKHQEKVINGIKHELDRLQPSSADTKEQGRKLRSQEGTRFKSELSAYFPDYDEVIGNDPKEQHVLNLETPIVVVDDLGEATANPPLRSTLTHANGIRQLDHYPIRGYSDSLFGDLFDSQQIDFSFLETRYKGKTPDDPLPDSYFEPAHKKAERLERSIRNSEKGRAQHEKDQIIRLLDGLQGHDWLRTMGVSGITESRKKTFEPAREHFIKGCKVILEKFRLWSLEEKRRKLEKERALAEEAKAREEEDESEAEEEEGGGEEEEEDEEQEEEEGGDEDDIEEASDDEGDEEDEEDSPGDGASQSSDQDVTDRGGRTASESDPPDYSDVDASIAKQLREEAMARSKVPTKPGSKRRRGGEAESRRQQALPSEEPDPPPPPPPREFTSFFEKKYQRDAALSRTRRKGRTVVAWGHPVPEPNEADFDLPGEYRDDEILKANARRKRRDRREHRH